MNFVSRRKKFSVFQTCFCCVSVCVYTLGFTYHLIRCHLVRWLPWVQQPSGTRFSLDNNNSFLGSGCPSKPWSVLSDPGVAQQWGGENSGTQQAWRKAFWYQGPFSNVHLAKRPHVLTPWFGGAQQWGGENSGRATATSVNAFWYQGIEASCIGQRPCSYVLLDNHSDRWVPLDPNLDNPNSQLILSLMEIMCGSLMYQSACQFPNSYIQRILLGFTFFRNEWDLHVFKTFLAEVLGCCTGTICQSRRTNSSIFQHVK